LNDFYFIKNGGNFKRFHQDGVKNLDLSLAIGNVISRAYSFPRIKKMLLTDLRNSNPLWNNKYPRQVYNLERKFNYIFIFFLFDLDNAIAMPIIAIITTITIMINSNAELLDGPLGMIELLTVIVIALEV